MLNSHWPWITPSKWRQSTQSYDSSSREAPSAIQSVAEEDEDVAEVHPNDVRARESKYDVKPLVLSDNDEDHTPVSTSPAPPRFLEGLLLQDLLEGLLPLVSKVVLLLLNLKVSRLTSCMTCCLHSSPLRQLTLFMMPERISRRLNTQNWSTYL